MTVPLNLHPSYQTVDIVSLPIRQHIFKVSRIPCKWIVFNVEPQIPARQHLYINGLVQESYNSSTLELHLSCTNPSNYLRNLLFLCNDFQ